MLFIFLFVFGIEIFLYLRFCLLVLLTKLSLKIFYHVFYVQLVNHRFKDLAATIAIVFFLIFVYIYNRIQRYLCVFSDKIYSFLQNGIFPSEIFNLDIQLSDLIFKIVCGNLRRQKKIRLKISDFLIKIIK